MNCKVNRTMDDITITSNIAKEEVTLYKDIMNQTLDRNRFYLSNKIYMTKKKVNSLFKGGFSSNEIEKPYSVMKFENILKDYLKKPGNIIFNKMPELGKLFSVQLKKQKKYSKFLNYQKINIGQLVLYNLKDKDKLNLYNVQNNNLNEKLLNTSPNFETDPDKDIIQTQFFREKFWKENSKVINLILGNRNRRNSLTKEKLKLQIDDINNKGNNSIEKNFNENKTISIFKMYNDSFKKRNLLEYKGKTLNLFNKSKNDEKNFYCNTYTPRNMNIYSNANNSTKTDRLYLNNSICNQVKETDNVKSEIRRKKYKTYYKTNACNTTINLFKIKKNLKNQINSLNLYVDKTNKKLIKLISTNISSERHKLKDMIKKTSVKEDLIEKTDSGQYYMNSYKIKNNKKNKSYNLRLVKSIYEDAKKDLGLYWNKKPEEKIKLMSDKFNKMDNEIALNIIGRAYNHKIKGYDLNFSKEIEKEGNRDKKNKEARKVTKKKLELSYNKIMEMLDKIKVNNNSFNN